ncbi:hypothetical protein BpHYR1_026538 [Brachionus plicatilis]|uniref:Uncharacterized protein n=1 Tax=Brachionus plicatilis TaxID=10195 RepID=A0A3M7P773_BRAPC|nr:hypothetical protein BpHYR1_026538 [Brachionus plicatilis]
MTVGMMAGFKFFDVIFDHSTFVRPVLMYGVENLVFTKGFRNEMSRTEALNTAEMFKCYDAQAQRLITLQVLWLLQLGVFWGSGPRSSLWVSTQQITTTTTTKS